MTRSGLRAVLLVGAALTAAPAHAEDSADAAVVQPIFSERGGGTANAALARLFPVEDILAEIARATGASFIFDSRIIREKRIGPIDMRAPLRRSLKSELKKADLELHRVGRNTYAITETAPRIRLASLAPTPVAATTAAAAPLVDMIVVTASAASALAATGGENMYVIDQKALQQFNAAAPAQIIHSLPQSLASVSSANTARFGSLEGLNLADLRGLGSRETQVLLNGRRRTPTPGGNGLTAAVDLNAFAEPLLERIEVMDRPGPARLGHDAVAGAVNFVTRRSYEGVEIGARKTVTQRGEGGDALTHFIAGDTFDDGAGRFVIGAAAARFDGLRGGERHATAHMRGFALNGVSTGNPLHDFTPGFGGSTSTPNGAFAGVIVQDGSLGPVPGGGMFSLTGNGGFERYAGRPDQRYNALEPQHIIIPLDAAVAFAAGERDIGGGFTAFLESNFAFTRSDVELAALPGTLNQGKHRVLADAVEIALDHPTVPAALRNFVTANYGADARGVVIDRRWTELGPREQRNDRRSGDVVAGLRREFDDGARIEASYRYGAASVRVIEENRLDRSRLATALDPALCAATAGCAPVNLFVSGGVTSAAVAFLRAPQTERRMKVEEHDLSFVATAPLRAFFADDGEAGFSLSVRREALSQENFSQSAQSAGTFDPVEIRGARTVIDGAATIDAPLVRAGAPFRRVDLSLAMRLTASGVTELAHNFEGGLDWRPFGGVTLYAKGNLGERPPNIAELFAADPTIGVAAMDPCAASATRTAIVAANCASSGPLGAPAVFKPVSRIAPLTSWGNPDLEPERTSGLAFGFALAPGEWLDALPGNLLLSATWLEYTIDNRIYGTDSFVARCYESENLSSPYCGENTLSGGLQIVRDPVTREIVALNRAASNGGGLRWRGADFELLYAYEPASLGPIDRLWASALHTVATDVRSIDDRGNESVRDGLLDNPRHRSLFSAGVEMGPLSLRALAQRRGRLQSSDVDAPSTRVPAVTTVDLNLRYDLGGRIALTFGVKNLTDRDPPLFPFAMVADTAPQYYDIKGRRFTLGAVASF